jgi:uncharacterized delta-60 repeat protein
MTTISKTALCLFSVALLVLCPAGRVRAQSALDAFNPGANDNVHTVVVQSDGKILIGGEFVQLQPNGGAAITRKRMARLNPDGTVDTAFNPNADGTVRSIAIQADGKIVVGGDFNVIGGQTRNFIARLDPVTGLADSFNPNAGGSVHTVALQSDGKILAGGSFAAGTGQSGIGGAARQYIARLDPITGLVDSFNPNANGIVDCIVVQPDGKILVGGLFGGPNSIGGQTRNRIARLDPSTGLADSFDPNSNNLVHTIAVEWDGKVLLGGYFTSIGGQMRNNVARLDPVTGLADSFDPNPDSLVRSIVVQADGKILLGGDYSTLSPNGSGAVSRVRLARCNPDGTLDSAFNPSVFGLVLSIATQTDRKILVGGGYTTVASNGGTGVPRLNIARLETDGRLDQTLDLNTVGTYVQATAIQPDGKVLIGGKFTSVLGVARSNIARLNSDGTLDAGFNPNANGDVMAIAVQEDGKILVGGDFHGTNSIGGQTRNYIARLAANGAPDSFDPNANSTVHCITVQADRQILVGGFFHGTNSIGGQTRNYIARLNAPTGAADSFDPNATNVIYSITVQPDGKILVGGQFNGTNSIGGATRNYIARLDGTGAADSFNPNADGAVYSIAVQAVDKVVAGGFFSSIGGQSRNKLARLSGTTGLADSFNPTMNDTVYSIAVQADGKILAGGYFTSVSGLTRNHLARLDASTGAPDSFDPNADNFVFSIALAADGKVFAGGTFANVGGQPRNLFARLTNNTAALQTLPISQTSILWTRGGASMQFARVTFEYSSDNVTYTLLGSGTAIGGDWTFTGLSLPSNVNFYIRARGFYRSGDLNGSESIAESVRNVFLPGGFCPDGNLDTTFSVGPSFGQGAAAIVPLPDGKILVGGFFHNYQGNLQANGFTRLNSNGSIDSNFNPSGLGADAAVRTVVVQADGKILIGGYFTQYNGVQRNGVARLLPNGTLDTGFIPGTPPNTAVLAIRLQSSGYVVIGGSHLIGRLDGATGALDSAFNSNGGVDRFVESISVQSDDKIIIGGDFTTYNAVPCPPRIVRLNANGSLDTSFLSLGTDNDVSATALEPGPAPNKILIGGYFSKYGSTTIYRVARLLPNGSLDPSFNASGATSSAPNSTVAAISILSDGKIVIGGRNASNPALSVARLFASGALDPAFDPAPGTGLDLLATAIAVQADGKVLIGGDFVSYSGQSADGLVRVCSSTPPASYMRLLNISTRVQVGTGDAALIGGFIITGSTPMKIIARAMGPTLTAANVPGALQDPTLELYNGSTLVAGNDDWRQPTQNETDVLATGIPPGDDHESAVVQTLNPGAYTVVMRGKNATTGVGLVEVYDLTQSPTSELANISTRGQVLTQNKVLIGGFILGGAGTTGVVVRAIGPSLAQAGINNPLPDPTLELFNGYGMSLGFNDNWGTDPNAAQVSAKGLAPTNTLESAIAITLSPGPYTAIVAGASSGTGIGLVEIYNVH